MDKVVFYNVIGYPNEKKFKEICLLLDDAGCRFLELGIPSSNPVKEGETIGELHESFKKNIDVPKLTELLIWIKDNTDLKIVLMTYFDGFLDYRLAELSKELYSSILCVDNDLEEYPDIRKVKFYHKDMDDSTIQKNLENNEDFCYVNSGLEKTGGTLGDSTEYQPLLEQLRQFTKLPLFVGFGVVSREDVETILENGGDGAIIGSHFIKMIQKDTNQLSTLKEYLASFQL